MSRMAMIVGMMRLDPGVSLSEELNQAAGTGRVLDRAETGRLRDELRGPATGLEPEEMLVLAIVRQAAEDWRRAVLMLSGRPDHPEALALRRETERFFRSRWFHQLVDLDGEELLERLKREEGIPDVPPGRGSGLRKSRPNPVYRRRSRKKQSAGKRAGNRKPKS